MRPPPCASLTTQISGRGFVFFPLVIHAFDLVVSSIGSLAVRLRKPYPQVSRRELVQAGLTLL